MCYTREKIEGFDYKISKTGKTLTITGSGKIPQQEDCLSYPWNGFPCKHIIISEGIWEIPCGAIQFPEAESVRLPDSLVNINAGAFDGMRSLKRLCFGKYVMNIADCFFDDILADFDGTEPLREFAVDKHNPVYTMVGGVLFTKDLKTLVRFPVGKPVKGTYAVRKGVEKIAPYAFSMTGERVQSIKLPSTVGKIGKGAFSYSSIVRVVLPPAITEIPEDAFACCWQMKEIDLPAGIKAIGEGAFSYAGITDITIPEGVERIGLEAFANSNLGTISLPSSLRFIERNAFADLMVAEGRHRRYTLTVKGSLTKSYDPARIKIEEEGNKILLAALAEVPRH